MVYPSEGVALNYWIYTVLSNAPNPNAVRVFIDWLTSPVGQEAIAMGPNPIYPIRKGAPSPEGMATIAALEVIPTDFQEYMGKMNEIIDMASKAFGLPIE